MSVILSRQVDENQRMRQTINRQIDDYYEVRTMADITTLPLLRHLRSAPTTHVLHLSHGQTRHDAAGLSFWFRPLSAAISEVPVDDRELPLQFRARTSDFQEVFVQLTVTFRVTEPS